MVMLGMKSSRQIGHVVWKNREWLPGASGGAGCSAEMLEGWSAGMSSLLESSVCWVYMDVSSKSMAS